MITKSCKISISLTGDLLDALDKIKGDRSPYIAEAVRRRLESEGHLPGTPAHDIRDEALAAAEIAGPQRVLAALQAVKAEAYANPPVA